MPNTSKSGRDRRQGWEQMAKIPEGATVKDGKVYNDGKRGFAPPFPDRLTEADYARFRAAPALRRAMLAKSAPWWRRALAKLPDPQKPLDDWIESAKTKARNRP